MDQTIKLVEDELSNITQVYQLVDDEWVCLGDIANELPDSAFESAIENMQKKAFMDDDYEIADILAMLEEDDDLEINETDEDYILDEIKNAPELPPKFSKSGFDLSFLLEDEYRERWQAKDGWTKVWPDIDLKIDPCMAAADNYLLFGIANNSFVEIVPRYFPSDEEIRLAGELLEATEVEIEQRVRDVMVLRDDDPTLKLEELNREADTQYRILIDNLDESFRQYSHLACGGELRYMLKSDPFYSQERRWAWTQWAFVYEKYGIKGLETMTKMFNENGYGAFGGKKWAAASEILLGREAGTLGPDELTNKQLFIDRVFTLEHNTGSFLNKMAWANNRVGREKAGGHWATMKTTVLPAHCSNPVDIRTMYAYASENVQNLLDKYFNLAKAYGLEVNGIWEEKKPDLLAKTTVKNSTAKSLNWDNVPDFEDDDDEDDIVVEALVAAKAKQKALVQAAKKPVCTGTMPHPSSVVITGDPFSYLDSTPVYAVVNDPMMGEHELTKPYLEANWTGKTYLKVDCLDTGNPWTYCYAPGTSDHFDFSIFDDQPPVHLIHAVIECHLKAKEVKYG